MASVNFRRKKNLQCTCGQFYSEDQVLLYLCSSFILRNKEREKKNYCDVTMISFLSVKYGECTIESIVFINLGSTAISVHLFAIRTA